MRNCIHTQRKKHIESLCVEQSCENLLKYRDKNEMVKYQNIDISLSLSIYPSQPLSIFLFNSVSVSLYFYLRR